ncbi:oleosin G-like [Wolffia australiana]
MADRPPERGVAAILRRLVDRSPNSSQVLGFLTLVVSGAILLFFAGLTLTATVLGVIFLTPLAVLTFPLWMPAAAVATVVTVAVVLAGGSGAAVVAAVSWGYKYLRGGHPIGSERLDYARSRIADTAGHVKEYAREYGGFLRGRIKDAAPSA